MKKNKRYFVNKTDFLVLKTFYEILKKNKYRRLIIISKKDFIKNLGVSHQSFCRNIGNSYLYFNKKTKD